MGRATVDGAQYPAPNVNGMPTAGGAGYWGERAVIPRLTPRSWLSRILTPIRRTPYQVGPFFIQPVNRRAGGAD